jgi:3-hydroxybutyryl-CoA dehydrogenase
MTCVAVVGTGLLGRGIAEVIVRHGVKVILHDSAPASLDSARQHITQLAAPLGVEVSAEASLEAAAAADFVLEAVVENLELKQQIFSRLGAANARAILMSNSSVLPIGEIARYTPAPERAVGTHWWNPPQLIPVVELIRGPHTSAEVLQRCAQLLRQLGKQPIHVERDVPGFVGNRLQHALWREAIGLVAAGVSAASVDRVIAATLGVTLAHRGPIAEMGRLGLLQVQLQLHHYLPLIVSERGPSQLLRDKVAAGDLGAKSGRGFFPWPAGAREQSAARLQQYVQRRLRSGVPDPGREPEGSPALPPAEIALAERLRAALWREALALVADGVCDAATVDLMACNTIGLRLASMAPLENADYVGLDLTLAIHEAVLPSLNASTVVPPLLPHIIPATHSVSSTSPSHPHHPHRR